MDSTTALGIAGLVATALSSCFGIYYTARARTASMRDHLYAAQLTLLQELMKEVGRINRIASVLADPAAASYHAEATADLRGALPALAKIEDAATVLLPVNIYSELKKYSSLAAQLHDRAGICDEVWSHSTKLGLLIRGHLGVEELSAEAIGLLGTAGDQRRVLAIPATALRARKKE